jgi:CheY-like chemotaxis protein
VAFTEVQVLTKRVLVLEDNLLIAMEAEDILKSLGVEHVEIATDLTQAAALIEEQTFDFVFLDVKLGPHTSFDFAGVLIARGVAFGFVSGYGEDASFPAALRDIPRIGKPFNDRSLGSLLGLAANGRS